MQLAATTDKALNLDKARKYIFKAKEKDADIVILPELYMALAIPGSGLTPAGAAESIDGPFVSGLAQTAKENSIYVVCGIFETKDDRRAYNTTVFINRDGQVIYAYRKTHLYDAFKYKESDTIAPGDHPVQTARTEFGRIGLMVCYELRFPEIARLLALQGAGLIIMPSGWVRGPMKEAHWELLLRARAIENTVFICAANQTGNIFTGNSMMIDPMGVILASAGE
ncbi:carbon-nitrogen hydrolase family protein [Terrilactibacillus sp. S3-3]|nr:carbon-nitrogen hydrolase family protein [Terrilactibacillus sp. S3-3]